jgi:hypothetical protein
MTSQHCYHRRIVAPALAALCLALPGSASAIAQSEHPTDRPSVEYPPKPGDTPSDFPGMPGTPTSPPATEASASSLPDTPSSDGFDWPSAAIGAGGAGLLVVVSVGGLALASHGRLRVTR